MVEIEERKQFFKMLLTPMSVDEKLDELWDLEKEELDILLKQFEVDEDYEICHAIQIVLGNKNIAVGDTVSYWEMGQMKYSWLKVLALDGDMATCSVIVAPENTDERPTHLDTMEVDFNLADLRLVRKNII